MFFFGKLDTGKSVKSLQTRALELAERKQALAEDVLKSIDARKTVIAQIGGEIDELMKINAF